MVQVKEQTIKEEKIFTVPLRREILKVPRYERASKSVKALKKFLYKHLKTRDIIISPNINIHLHSQGRKNPPKKIKVKAWKEDQKYKVELSTIPIEDQLKKEKELEEKVKVLDSEKTEIKAEETEKEKVEEEEKETLEKEKEESLKKPLIKKEIGKHEEEKMMEEKIQPGFKKIERLKRVFPKSQKPIHEKKK